jgi:hypothetical protein
MYISLNFISLKLMPTVCVWLVAFGIKIAKGDEPEGNSENFPIGT